MNHNPIEGEFQEEVLRLFALEALEWIRQIKAALLELEGGPPPERWQVLCEMIHRNLTNLKGSAATVDLPSIGNLAFMLVPLLQHMQKEQQVTNSDYYPPLRQGLDALSSVIGVLAMAETKAFVVGDLESITRHQADALQSTVTKARTSGASFPEKVEAHRHAVETPKIVEPLLKLRHVRSVAGAPTRNLVDQVLRKLHGVQNVDSATIPARAISQVMQDLRDQDARFLEEMRHRSASIQKALVDLKTADLHASDQQKKLREALREATFLHAAVLSMHAPEILQFVTGLETFLLTLSYKRVACPSERYDAVTARLGSLSAMAQEWADLGQKEWAGIEKVLTDIMGSHFDMKSATTSAATPH
jgi:chemotaxis protein histidine kinase CheA